jgi:hypothetical protein
LKNARGSTQGNVALVTMTISGAIVDDARSLIKLAMTAGALGGVPSLAIPAKDEPPVEATAPYRELGGPVVEPMVSGPRAGRGSNPPQPASAPPPVRSPSDYGLKQPEPSANDAAPGKSPPRRSRGF